MSYNDKNVYQSINMNGHEIKNLKPESHPNHPLTDYLADGFRYYNTTDRVYYQYYKTEDVFKKDSAPEDIDLSGYYNKTETDNEIDKQIQLIDYPVDSVNGQRDIVVLTSDHIESKAVGLGATTTLALTHLNDIKANKTDVESSLNNKVNTSDFTTAINKKANSEDVYTKVEANDLFVKIEDANNIHEALVNNNHTTIGRLLTAEDTEIIQIDHQVQIVIHSDKVEMKTTYNDHYVLHYSINGVGDTFKGELTKTIIPTIPTDTYTSYNIEVLHHADKSNITISTICLHFQIDNDSLDTKVYGYYVIRKHDEING